MYVVLCSSHTHVHNTVSVKAFSINTFKNFNFQTKVNHTQSVKSNQCITCEHLIQRVRIIIIITWDRIQRLRIIIITWVCIARSHHHLGMYGLFSSHHLGMYGLFSSSPGYVWPVFIHHLGMYQVFPSSHRCLQGARTITRVLINSNYLYNVKQRQMHKLQWGLA